MFTVVKCVTIDKLMYSGHGATLKLIYRCGRSLSKCGVRRVSHRGLGCDSKLLNRGVKISVGCCDRWKGIEGVMMLQYTTLETSPRET